ncbi:trans-sialidase, partial [Trypanosoma cruzi]
ARLTTAQSFHCGRSASITRCGGFRKSRISEVQAVPPQDCPCCLTGAAPARNGSSAGEQAPECQRRGSLSALTSTRPAVGVPVAWPSLCATPFRGSACRSWNQLPGDHRLLRVPTGQPQHVRGESLQPSYSNCSRFTLCERHSSPWSCSTYCGRPEFTP